jgi:outer membrane protein OmpA-like peptidoglycan-associated protein
MIRALILIAYMSSLSFAYAQSQANIWYFGNFAGLDFSSGTPVALTDGQLSTEEGCVTICDRNGALLFYTNGVSVWNKHHKVMPNGTALYGSPSSTSSGVVIRHPGDENLFYLFTVAAEADTAGLRYSMIDIRLDSARGDVIKDRLNLKLKTPVTEKLSAALHRNGKDYWILAHEWKNNRFLAYLITATGLQPEPVVSEVGGVHDGAKLNTQGFMKLNPDGTNIALAMEETGVLELFDFDNQAGVVSKPIPMSLPKDKFIYGIEFSPNGSLLYVSGAGAGEVYQYNLQAGSEDSVRASAVMVGKTEPKTWVGALQIATDGKIYFTVYKQAYLGAIEKPNVVGMECGFNQNVVSLAGKLGTLGLPTFSQNFFYKAEEKKVEYFIEGKIVKGKTLVLRNMLFDFAKASLKTVSYGELDKVVRAMKAEPALKAGIAGHTDNIGNKSSNITLSRNRAKAVVDYLVSKGISASRLSLTGHGSSVPVAGNDTDAGRALNRRVEIVFE